jgi:hypothetical protein
LPDDFLDPIHFVETLNSPSSFQSMIMEFLQFNSNLNTLPFLIEQKNKVNSLRKVSVMKYIILSLTVFFFAIQSLLAADLPAEFVKASEKRRREIKLGGNFKPNPTDPVIVAVGHGARILLSRDDGKTWKQVFWGFPGSDHGAWATNQVAYTNGVFAIPVGWTNPTSYLASEDGVNWRHLTNGKYRRSFYHADFLVNGWRKRGVRRFRLHDNHRDS